MLEDGNEKKKLMRQKTKLTIWGKLTYNEKQIKLVRFSDGKYNYVSGVVSRKPIVYFCSSHNERINVIVL